MKVPCGLKCVALAHVFAWRHPCSAVRWGGPRCPHSCGWQRVLATSRRSSVLHGPSHLFCGPDCFLTVWQCVVPRGLYYRGLGVIQCHFCILLTEKVTRPAGLSRRTCNHLFLGGVAKVTLQKGRWDGRDCCGHF